MNRKLIIGIVILLILGASAAGVFLWQRSKNQTYRAQIDEPRVNFNCDSLKNFETGPEYVLGSWGNLPEKLRELPQGASLCGFIPSQAGTVIAMDNQNDQQLFEFYRQKLPAAGCDFRGTMGAPVKGYLYRETLIFSCQGQVGSLYTYRTENAYMISFGVPAAKPVPNNIPTPGPTASPQVFVPPTPGTVAPPYSPAPTATPKAN